MAVLPMAQFRRDYQILQVPATVNFPNLLLEAALERGENRFVAAQEPCLEKRMPDFKIGGG